MNETQRMAYTVNYNAAGRLYAASVDTLYEALAFAAQQDTVSVTGPDDLLLEDTELADAIANNPPPEPVVDEHDAYEHFQEDH